VSLAISGRVFLSRNLKPELLGIRERAALTGAGVAQPTYLTAIVRGSIKA
jgi:hypothetical protein